VVLSDAMFSSAFRSNLLGMIYSNSSVSSGDNCVSGKAGSGLNGIPFEGLTDSRVLGVEQSNTSILYGGGRLFLKVFRRLEAGINPDAEMSRFLCERQHFAHIPAYCGELEVRIGQETYPMGLMLEGVENNGDAWSWALKILDNYYRGEDSGKALERIAQLGEYTAAMHLALASDEEDDAFKPEPLSRSDFEQLAASVTARLDALIPMLRNRQSEDALAGEVLSREAALRRDIAQLRSLAAGPAKIRHHHGDYHLGQVLDLGGDWMIIDFEGEPTRSLAERRQKRSPLRDVAGMLRSFHYAAHSACPAGQADARKRAEEWSEAASSAFLAGYMARAEGGVFLPAAASDRDALLRAFVLEKALYEVDYEMNNRPAWLPIPLRGILRAVKN
jgi:trehalose synthase-fused probable maltokinase